MERGRRPAIARAPRPVQIGPPRPRRSGAARSPRTRTTPLERPWATTHTAVPAMPSAVSTPTGQERADLGDRRERQHPLEVCRAHPRRRPSGEKSGRYEHGPQTRRTRVERAVDRRLPVHARDVVRPELGERAGPRADRPRSAPPVAPQRGLPKVYQRAEARNQPESVSGASPPICSGFLPGGLGPVPPFPRRSQY